MEEILIVSNYYPPEKGAAPNRIEQLAWKLKQNNYRVSVVCPLANYPKGQVFPEYRNKFTVSENLSGIAVKRLWIYPSNSQNPLKRILSILSFSTGLFFHLLFKKIPHKVIVQSPPLLLSFVAVFILSLRRRKVILNVSDLWPLAAVELGVLKSDTLSHKMLLLIERFIYKKATLILGQSNEIITHVKSVVPHKECFLYRNFPDHPKTEITAKAQTAKIKLFYAGLLGVAQGVLEVCEKIELEKLPFEFHIFGDGAEKSAIEKYISTHPEKSIIFHGMLDRADLIATLASFDIALVPLKTRIYGSVPSKIFEYSALGIAILYFGGGEGETIVADTNLGWVSGVGDFMQLNQTLKEIATIDRETLEDMKRRILKTSAEEFNLDVQIERLIKADVF